MHVTNFEQSFENIVDWILAVDLQESTQYVEKIRSAHSSLSQRDLAQKIVDEQSITNGLFGALTGLGSAISLPIMIPIDIIKAWKIQGFMIRSIAQVYGYTPQNADLKTAILLLVSSGSIEELKQFLRQEAAIVVSEHTLSAFDHLKKTAIQRAVKEGSKFATKALAEALSQVIGKKIAKKVLQKSLGVIAAPAFGAVIGGGLDWMTTQAVGKVAIDYFENL
ncbi:MAG: EcsC family protein [Hydrococcus sp. C42_A2020_068]|nr:EcsC family protein [Hydrococcus sp. C42_A2020_068]